jgi:hypothetical protein
MFPADFPEDFTGRPRSAGGYIVESLPDSLEHVHARGDVKQALVGLGVLYDRLSLALYGEHDRPLGFLDLLDKLTRSAPESGQRLNVFGDIEHILWIAPF